MNWTKTEDVQEEGDWEGLPYRSSCEGWTRNTVDSVVTVLIRVCFYPKRVIFLLDKNFYR